MALIELKNLSSNWKQLQKTLQPSTSKPASSKSQERDGHESLKRKRSGNTNGSHAQVSPNTRNGHVKYSTKPLPRKRQKMEEPSSSGASNRRHDHKILSKSASMPSLKHPTLVTDDDDAATSISVLTPSPHHPDTMNEGSSRTALPGKYIAIDCEMVGTGPEPDRDSALARVSAVNYHGHQIYDSYVRVKVPVTDYRTAVSGIEPKHLRKDIARPFKEVHNDLKVLLEGRILVGHAVKNDLDALLLKHDKRYIRDTSKYSRFRELAPVPGRTPSLRGLVEKLLGVEIQTGKHDSVEDARATMALFRLEKESFEREVAKIYGAVRMKDVIGPSVAEADAGGGEEGLSKPKKKNKKKKKKKH
ncbi:RNA exonuclease 4 [Lophiostoma macrostomum CBS 122681]|uniref:RNA exonuclease 4 n=1 Tax=Lophiostoma macrostomum CBS 122681 TaxID=1314788 RepID=A0A6A6TKK5_9PLEO|nr:RNA exonuclease 4 [Lophiostoma macrostomum CBS 122681]